MNEVIKTMLNHRTNRSFVPGHELLEEELDQIIACAKQAPSWMNGQHYSIVVAEGEVKKQIADLMREKSPGNANHIEKSAAVLLFFMDFTNIKLAIDMEGGEFDIKDQYEPLIVGSMDTALAMENALLAAESLGYGTVFCGSVRSFAKEIAEIVKTPENALLLCGLSIGVRAEDSTEKVKPRLPLEANVGFNTYPQSNSDVLTQYRKTMVDFAEARETKTWTKKFADVYSTNFPAEATTRELLEKSNIISKK